MTVSIRLNETFKVSECLNEILLILRLYEFI